MSVYLDHAATSPPTKNVLDYYRDVLSEYAYNPSSMHAAGKKARALIDASLAKIGRCFGADSDQIIVTSGGTEAINMALTRYQTPRRFRPHLLISRGEHKAVSEVARRLATGDVTCQTMPLDEKGRPSIDQVELDPKRPPSVISVIGVSNETGAVTDLQSIAAWRDQYAPHAVIHVDDVQAAGKIAIDFKRSGVDFISLSGHKWGAPMGLGFLIAKKRTFLTPLIAGAGQQGGLRSGSENAPLLAATAYAAELAVKSLAESTTKAQHLKTRLIDSLVEKNVSFRLVSPDSALPHIDAIAFPLMGETLVRVLSKKAIYIGRGAACSGGKDSVNQALVALGVSPEESQKTVRISFSKENQEKDVADLVLGISEAIQQYATELSL